MKVTIIILSDRWSHSLAFRQFGPLTGRPSRHQPSRRHRLVHAFERN